MMARRAHFPDGKQVSLSARMAFGLLLIGALAASAPSQIEAYGHWSGSAHATEIAPEFTDLDNLTLANNAKILKRGEDAAEQNAMIPLSRAPLETMAAFRTGGGSSAVYDVALTCLTQAVYYEAAVEPVEGKRAVAQVVLNRVRHPAYPASVCGVVYEGWDRPVCQFSFTCDGSLRRAPLAEKWNQSRDVARAALDGYVEKSVGSATHYHADYVLPRWAYNLDKVNSIGRHLFYRFPGRAGQMQSFTARWTGRESKPVIDYSRFELADAGDSTRYVSPAFEAAIPRDPTDRRAENDIGGRMDPTKQWRLAIPDPVNASAGYDAARQSQSAAHQNASNDERLNGEGQLQ